MSEKIKCDGIIFDVDGTIWDSTEIVQNAWNKALAETEYPERVTADQLKTLFGLPMIEIVNRIVSDPSMEKKQALLAKLSVYEFDFLNENGGRVYDGLEKTLSELSKRYPLSIVSNCQEGYIQLVYNKTGLGQYFVKGYCPDDTGLLKAGNIRKMADELGLKNPIYVGDTHMDEEACREAGVPFVFADYGFGHPISPDAVIEKPEDLLGLLE